VPIGLVAARASVPVGLVAARASVPVEVGAGTVAPGDGAAADIDPGLPAIVFSVISGFPSGASSAASDKQKTLATGEGPGLRRCAVASGVLPPSPSRLPPGAGNKGNKPEYEELELAEQGYGKGSGQANGHAATIGPNGDGDEAGPVGQTHDGWHSCYLGRRGLYPGSPRLSSALQGPVRATPKVRGGVRCSWVALRPVAMFAW